MPELAILMLCVVLLTFLLGIPLLLKPDSLIPDIISFGILSVVVMAFIWSSGDYWIVLPILAVMAFVAWLDRDGQATPVGKSAAPQPAEGRRGEGAARVSDRTRLRLRLWRVANHLGLAVVASVLVLLGTGSAFAIVSLIVPWILVTLVASAAFRHSFYRSHRRDACAPTIGPSAP